MTVVRAVLLGRVEADLVEIRPDGGQSWSGVGGNVAVTPAEAVVLRRLEHPTTREALTAGLTDDVSALLGCSLDRLIEVGLVSPLDLEPVGSAGLFGAPVAPWPQARLTQPDVAVIGVAHDLGATFRPGARFGPERLRRISTDVFAYRERLGRPVGMHDPTTGSRVLADLRLVDLGNVLDPVRFGAEQCLADLHTMVERVLHAGVVPLVLGGDHSIAGPAIAAAAAAHEGLQVVHLDAHHDFGRVRETGDGTIRHHGNFLDWVVGDPRVSRVVSVGVRQLTADLPEESARRVVLPTAPSGPEALLGVLDPDLPCWVTLDLDVLDPAYFPATGTPLPGGWSPDQLLDHLTPVLADRVVVGLDVTEFSPDEDRAPDLVVAALVLRLLDALGRGRA